MLKYEVHWKDFNSPLCRNEIWTGLSCLWPKLFNLPYIEKGIKSEKNTIKYFMDMKAARKFQAIFAKRIIRNPNELENLIKLAGKWGKEMNKFTQTIFQADLSKWSVKRLENAYKKFAKLQTREYSVGVLLVMLDSVMGPLSIDNLAKKILRKKFKGKEFEKAYSAFTTPTFDSFAREQEYDLLKIYDKITAKSKFIKVLKNGSAQNAAGDFKRLSPEIYHQILNHTKKWAWIYYVYAGPAWNEIDFVQMLCDWTKKGVLSQQLENKWQKTKEKIKNLQNKYLKVLTISKNKKKILLLASKIVWAKPRRKDYQSKSYWHMEKFFRELALRLGISLREARSMTQKMIFRSLKNRKVNLKRIHEFYDLHICISSRYGARVLTGKKAKKFSKKIFEKKIKSGKRVFVGSPACPGKATGRVCIVNSPEDMPKMKEGDILVSASTTPSIIWAMKKAAAILTDEGGLTCHAAIVSRELNIPCVVGFGTITSAVKDGSKIEVDAAKGIVKIF